MDAEAPVRYFYVVNPPEPVYAQLAYMRALVDPTTCNPPHITVQGPLSEPLSVHEQHRCSAKIRGKVMEVSGVGTFYGPEQHTVYLKIGAPALRAIWNKPDYPNFSPHLTMYDGDSREEAEAVRAALLKANVHFVFPMGALTTWNKREKSLGELYGVPSDMPFAERMRRLADVRTFSGTRDAPRTTVILGGTMDAQSRMRALAKQLLTETAERAAARTLRRYADSMQALQNEMKDGTSEQIPIPEAISGDTSMEDVQITEELDALGYTAGNGQVPGTYRRTAFGGDHTEWVVAVSLSERVLIRAERTGMHVLYTVNQRTADSLDEALAVMRETIVPAEEEEELARD